MPILFCSHDFYANLADMGGLLQASTRGEAVLFLRCFTTCTDNVTAMKDCRGLYVRRYLTLCVEGQRVLRRSHSTWKVLKALMQVPSEPINNINLARASRSQFGWSCLRFAAFEMLTLKGSNFPSAW